MSAKGTRLEQKPELIVQEGFYFMEVCNQVRAVNIVLREKDIPLHVIVEPNRICTQSYDGTVTIYPLTLEVDPSSCSSLRYKIQEGLALRLQIRSVEDIPPADVPTGALVARLGDAFQRLNGQPCFCKCKTCGINLLKQNAKFNRVLPLPSEQWEDLSASWTCCCHGKQSLKSNARRLKTDQYPFVPKDSEMYENEFFVIFCPDVVETSNVIVQLPLKSDSKEPDTIAKPVKSDVKCGRCLCVVGESILSESESVHTYNFYKSAIEFHSIYEGCLHSVVSLERILANQIANDVKASTVYKFLLEGDGKPYVMLQVLNTDAKILFHKPECQDKNGDGEQSYSCMDYPPRYIGAEEWEISMPRMKKADKEMALKDSKKYLERALTSLETTVDILKPERKLKSNIKELVPPDIWFLYSFSPNCVTTRQSCEFSSVGENNDCKIERVVKVLYASATTTSGQRISKEWQEDLNVRTLTFPYSICMNALLVLTSSTLSMPERGVAPDDFLFGFLRSE